MKTSCIIILLLAAGFTCSAQSYTLKGVVADDKGAPIRGIAVSLLQRGDSTLAYFGVSNEHGVYEIHNAAAGQYVLQAAGFGYGSRYSEITVPLPDGAGIPGIVLHKMSTLQLDSITVTAEKVPILFKKDTVEYNAGSFKTKPDAVTEDLLRKLPGVEVDKSGNIKAHGKDVKKVLVDGKEFFSDDMKVATKNLPADAVDKVQVYDAPSDAAMFSGIDDGDRNKTINLKLKSNKRKGYFGELEAGGGTDDRYKLNAKVYRFQPKTQFALLGMLNNINQFGFSLQDYLSFRGGLQGLLDGAQSGGAPMSMGSEEPGLFTAGAAGVNYTFEPRPGARYNISYMGNSADRRLEQESNSWNYTPTETFTRDEKLSEHDQDLVHRLSLNLRNEPDSLNQLRLRGTAVATNSSAGRGLLSTSSIESNIMNQLDSRTYNDGQTLNADGLLSWLHKSGGKWPVLNLSLSGGLQRSNGKMHWNNTTVFTNPAQTEIDNEFQNNDRQKYNYSGAAVITRTISATNYLDGELRAGQDDDRYSRLQGLSGQEATPLDSLSRRYERTYTWLRPGLSFRHNTKSVQLNAALRVENGMIQAPLSDAKKWWYALPTLSWEYFGDAGVNANLGYFSSINAPTAQQMSPLTDYTNPLQRIHGNPMLRPEYRHTLFASWRRYDQFSFTSMGLSAQGMYTHDKINFTRNIGADLSEDIYYTNVPDDYQLSGSANYSTPIRSLGVNINGTISESYNRGQSTINDRVNTNSSFTHSAKLGISNRKQDVWMADLTLAGDITDASYSIQQSLNNRFVHYNVTGNLSYKAGTRFYFSSGADIDHYDAQGFNDAITIPILKASASFYFLKSNRGTISISGYDLLDQNRSVRRVSQLNYLLEQRSNMIGRHFLLSFKYRLSHAGGKSGIGPMLLHP